jgi:predicted Zn-dependent peptidase
MTPRQSAALDALVELINSDVLSPALRDFPDGRMEAAANYPSWKQPPFIRVQVFGNPGVRHERLAEETVRLFHQLDHADSSDIDGAILRAQMRAAEQIDDIPTLASMLASSEAVRGDWRLAFQSLREFERLQVEDVRAAARSLFAVMSPQAAVASMRRP